jgi:hypothetical protein
MKNRHYFLVVAGVLFLRVSACCQVPDSLPLPQPVEDISLDTLPPASVSDTLKTKKEGFFFRLVKKDYPNPNKALLLAAVIPGGGQMYNKRWWKLPIVYGAYAWMINRIGYNRNYYLRFRDAYIAELKGELHEFSDTRLNAGDLRRIRDQFDKNKQLSYIGLVAVHLVQATEAFVDCHLKTFDVSDDLSVRLKPAFGTSPDGVPTLGATLAFAW